MDLGGIHNRLTSLADKMGKTIPDLSEVRRVKYDPSGHVEQAKDEFRSLLDMDNKVFNGNQDVDARPNHVRHDFGSGHQAEFTVSEDGKKIEYEETFSGKKGVVETFDFDGTALTRCTLIDNNGRLSAEIVSTPDGTTENAIYENWYLSGR